MPTENNTYNGWTNYATWRINLEIVDDMTDGWSEMVSDHQHFNGLSALADYIQETVEELVLGDMDTSNNLAASYAEAFLGEVSWYEIARNISDDNPNLIAKEEDL
jgi:hypothetical protein